MSSYRLRDDVPSIPDLSLVARDVDGVLAGAIRYWPISIVGDHTHKALLLGPVAVHPTRQGEGLGGHLIRQSIGRAAKLGWDRVMLVGDAPYYQRFGFTRLNGVMMPPPTNPDRVLAYDQTSGSWVGVQGDVRRYETSQPEPGRP